MTVSRFTALCLSVAVVAACSDTPRPDLARLYRVGMSDAAPVILIPGVFGSRLRDRTTGDEVWPGPWWRVLFSSYPELALEFDPTTQQPLPSRLEPYGIAEQVFGRDFYRPILQTLSRYGGYAPGTLGMPAAKGERRYYVFAYDWRQDNVASARELGTTAPTVLGLRTNRPSISRCSFIVRTIP